MQFSLIQKIRLGFGASLLLLFAISLMSVYSIRHNISNSNWVNHTYNVLFKLESIYTSVLNIETGVRGFILTNEIIFIEPYKTSVSKIDNEIVELNQLISDNPTQKKNVVHLKYLIKEKLRILKEGLDFFTEGKNLQVKALMRKGDGRRAMDKIRQQIKEMKFHEEYLLYERQKSLKISSGFSYLIIGLGNIVAIIMVIIGMYFINGDVAQKKKSADALVEKQEHLLALNNELEAFTYTISHDLRSPLRAIDGFSKMLDEDYGPKFDAEGNRLLFVIRDNARRMGKLIDDLLEFSRLNRRGINKITINMRQIVEGVIEEVKINYPLLSPNFIINKIENAPADASLIHQVWINLVSNAVKYSSKKSNQIIEIGSKKMEGNLIEYFVKDNGAGFQMEFKNKLFNIFQRLHSNKEFEGTGVGLAIVSRIVERHGGKIDATAEVEKGATFTFTLPAAKEI